MRKSIFSFAALAAIALVVGVALLADPAAAATPFDLRLAADNALGLLSGGAVLAGEIAVKALKAQRGEKLTVLEQIVAKAEEEKRDLNEEEQAAYDSAKKEIEAFDNRIARAEELEQQKLRNMLPAQASGGLTLPAQAARGPAPRHFKGPTAREDAYKSGMWIAAAVFGSESAHGWCAENGIPLARAGWDRPQGALSTGVNTAGGFLVPTEFETMIIDLRETYGVARQLCRVHPMGSDHTTVPRRASGLTAYAVGENEEITASEKGWDQVSLTARKWGVMTRWSNELNEDAIISMADDLGSEIAYAFAVKEDDALFNGDGSSTYHGIVGLRPKLIDGDHAAGAVDAASAHDTFAEIDASDLATVMAALPIYAGRQGPVWICSQQGKSLVFDRLAMAAGGNSKVDVGGRQVDSYDGYPIVVTPAMPTSTGDLSDVAMILFGAPRLAVLFGDRRGIALRVSADRYFEFDQLAIRGTERMDINVHDLGDGTTAGPVVGLIGE